MVEEKKMRNNSAIHTTVDLPKRPLRSRRNTSQKSNRPSTAHADSIRYDSGASALTDQKLGTSGKTNHTTEMAIPRCATATMRWSDRSLASLLAQAHTYKYAMAALIEVTSTIHPMAARPAKGTKTEMAMTRSTPLRGVP